MGQVRKPTLLATVLVALGVWALAGRLWAAPSFPTYSSPIALTSDDRFVWVVNPNVEAVDPRKNDSVTVHEVGGDVNKKVAEITVGDDPQCVAVTPDNKKAYVTNMASGTVSVIDAQTYQVINTVEVGTEPFGCALTPDGKKLYVANFASDDVSVIRTSDDRVITTIHDIGVKPRGLAITADGTMVYVTQFLAQLREGKTQADEGKDDSREGRVTVINTNKNRVVLTIVPQPIQVANFFVARGDTLDRIVFDTVTQTPQVVTSAFPNLLASVVIKNNRAYLPNTCSSPNGPVRFNVNVQSCLSVIDISTNRGFGPSLNMNDGVNFELLGTKLFNTNPIAVAFKHNSNEGFVALAATNRLLRVVLDAHGTPSINAPTAPVNAANPDNIIRIELKDPDEILQPDPNDTIGRKNPRGLVINSTDTRAYVMNLISRDIAVVDISGTDPTQYKEIAHIESTALPAPNSQADIIRRGHQLFNTAIGPEGTNDNAKAPAGRMSDTGWGSCYSCHPNGLTDSVTWMFTDGPRQSISMESTFEHPQPATAQLNAFGAPLLPFFHQRVLNWSAVRDEVQDFELNIRNVSGGQGLIAKADGSVDPCVFNLVIPANNPNNCPPETAITTGRSADLDAIAAYLAFGVRALSSPLRGQDVSQGRELFAEANCQKCHGGPSWTSSLVDFTPPPLGEPITAGQLVNFLCDVGTFDHTAFNEIQAGIAAAGQANLNAANGGLGFNIPSLVSVFAGAPYLHNGQCATLDCVLENVTHRSAGTNGVDTLHAPGQRKKLVTFLQSIDLTTEPFDVTARPCHP